jgi:hypothetical protein
MLGDVHGEREAGVPFEEADTIARARSRMLEE